MERFDEEKPLFIGAAQNENISGVAPGKNS